MNEMNVTTDPVIRLNRLCDWLEEKKNDSPYSAESWDELQSENDRLRLELIQITKIHNDLVSEYYDFKNGITNE
jgi:hypothetical protein